MTDSMRYTDPKFVLATGFAQLPKGTPMSDMQKVFACSLVVDRTERRIVDASFSFLMGLNEQFLKGLVIGLIIPDDWNLILQDVRERFLVPTQGAVLQALRAAIDRYMESSQQHAAE